MRCVGIVLAMVLGLGCSDSGRPPVGDGSRAEQGMDRGRGEARPDGGRSELRVDRSPDTKPRPPAKWETVAPLQTARWRHTATVLQDGTVLVAGGYAYDAVGYIGLASSERYVPQTNTWSAAGMMPGQHWGHQAALLKDGRVLVVGGCAGAESNSCMADVGSELFDPLNAATPWKKASSPLTSRRSHAATRLDDGRVLVVGGFSESANLDMFELYDPAKDAWSSPAAILSVNRNVPTATTLKSGKVLIAGGGESKVVHGTLELYDPATGSSKVLGAKLTEPRYGHTATLLLDGRVLFVGGGCDVGCLIKKAELYDPSNDSIISAGSPTPDLFLHAAALLADGRVLVAGGISKQARLFDPTTMSWSLTAEPAEHHISGALAVIGEQVLLIAGNQVPVGQEVTATVERYTP